MFLFQNFLPNYTLSYCIPFYGHNLDCFHLYSNAHCLLPSGGMSGQILMPWDQMNQCYGSSHTQQRKYLVVSFHFPQCSLEMGDDLQPVVTLNMVRRYFIDYPVYRDTIGQVRCEFGRFLNHHKRHEAISTCQ